MRLSIARRHAEALSELLAEYRLIGETAGERDGADAEALRLPALQVLEAALQPRFADRSVHAHRLCFEQAIQLRARTVDSRRDLRDAEIMAMQILQDIEMHGFQPILDNAVMVHHLVRERELEEHLGAAKDQREYLFQLRHLQPGAVSVEHSQLRSEKGRQPETIERNEATQVGGWFVTQQIDCPLPRESDEAQPALAPSPLQRVGSVAQQQGALVEAGGVAAIMFDVQFALLYEPDAERTGDQLVFPEAGRAQADRGDLAMADLVLPSTVIGASARHAQTRGQFEINGTEAAQRAVAMAEACPMRPRKTGRGG